MKHFMELVEYFFNKKKKHNCIALSIYNKDGKIKFMISSVQGNDLAELKTLEATEDNLLKAVYSYEKLIR